MQNINNTINNVEFKAIFPKFLYLVKSALLDFKIVWQKAAVAQITIIVLTFLVGMILEPIASAFNIFMSSLAFYLLSYGVIYNKPISFREFFKNNYKETIVLGFVFYLASFGGMYLLFVPGLIFVIAANVSIPAFIDQKLSGFESIRKSFYLTRGYRLDILFFIIKACLSMLLVNIVLLTPFAIMSMSNVFEKIGDWSYLSGLMATENNEEIFYIFSSLEWNEIVYILAPMVIFCLLYIVLNFTYLFVLSNSFMRVYGFLRDNNKFIPDQKYQDYSKCVIYVFFLVGLVTFTTHLFFNYKYHKYYEGSRGIEMMNHEMSDMEDSWVDKK